MKAEPVSSSNYWWAVALISVALVACNGGRTGGGQPSDGFGAAPQCLGYPSTNVTATVGSGVNASTCNFDADENREAALYLVFHCSGSGASQEAAATALACDTNCDPNSISDTATDAPADSGSNYPPGTLICLCNDLQLLR